MTNTTATLAAALDTTPRTLRKFLRSTDSPIAPVGKGSRYALPASKREVNSLAKKFTKWEAMIAEAKATKSIDEVDNSNDDAIDDDATDSLDDAHCPLDD